MSAAFSHQVYQLQHDHLRAPTGFALLPCWIGLVAVDVVLPGCAVDYYHHLVPCPMWMVQSCQQLCSTCLLDRLLAASTQASSVWQYRPRKPSITAVKLFIVLQVSGEYALMLIPRCRTLY